MSKLLIAPLYGDDPSYGVRELVQNAVDACRIRLAIDSTYNKETTHVRVDIDTEKKLFTIEDSGIGMTVDEIEKYFLTIGSSINSSFEWQKTRDSEGIYRTGHFGIGVLAAFLLGNRITVETRNIKSEHGYMFTVSLQDSFFQIDKIYKPEYGTIIRIECEKSSINRLEYATNFLGFIERGIENTENVVAYHWPWFSWYIELIPRVEYYLDSQLITNNSNRLEGYQKLNHSSINYGDVFWKPRPILKEINKVTYPRELIYNGFHITLRSNKAEFSLEELKNYINTEIPSLSITDLYNRLPINLLRSNIAVH